MGLELYREQVLIVDIVLGTGEAQDPYYMREFNNTHDFGQATPANIMKFVYT